VVSAVLLMLLGLSVALTVAGTQEASLAGASRADLVRILDGLTVRADRLDDEVARLEATRAELVTSADSAAAAQVEAERRVADLGILAGTTPAKGPGIEVRIEAPAGALSAGVLLRAVHELRDAGAEAIQVEGVGPSGQGRSARVVAQSAFLDVAALPPTAPADWRNAPPEAVVVGDTVLLAPVTIRAIGDPATLETALGIPGGVESEVAALGGVSRTTARGSLLVDAVVRLPELGQVELDTS